MTICLIALFCAPVMYADHIKVILLGGQSNMTGFGVSENSLSTTPFNYQAPQPNVQYYHDALGLTTLRPGGGNAFGPELSFGKTLAEGLSGDSFGLIKYARSGSSLSGNWKPTSGSDYVAFNATVTAGLNALALAGHTYEVTGMLWTQGENDAKNGRTAAQYEADLNGFIADIRGKYGTDLPFFISRLSSGQTEIDDVNPGGLAQIRTAQHNVAVGDANAYLIDTDSFGLKNDSLHFNTSGQISLGEAFGQAYISAVPEPSSLALLGLGGLYVLRRRRS